MTVSANRAVASPFFYPWLVPLSHRGNGRYRISGDGYVEIVVVRNGVVTHLRGTAPHPELAAMVASTTATQPPAMRPTYFCINEWRHVLVKIDGVKVLAGRYDRSLDFEREDGTNLAVEAPRELRPGQEWTGSRVGMRYAIAATGKDVYARCQDATGTERKEYLSRYVPEAAQWVSDWSKPKPGGGALYINESRELFGPAGEERYIYFGYAPLDLWFPSPPVNDDWR